jgi:hypothetical protein
MSCDCCGQALTECGRCVTAADVTAPECPAWEDGRHMFVPQKPIVGGTRPAESVDLIDSRRVKSKRCACGAEVKRAR